MEAGGVLKFQDCMLDGDKYACTMLAHDDCAEAMGIVDVQNDLVVELADGKIKVMSITVDPNDWRKFTDEFLPKFSEWVKANRPADWARITSGVNNREVGKVQSEVCKAYIASQAGGATAPVPDILKAYQDAYNQHNADAVLALFVDNGLSFVDSGSLNTGDKGTLRKYLEYQMALGTVQTVKECTLDGDKYRCTLLVHDDCSPVLVALGIFKQNQEVQEDLVVGSKDGKMQTMEITMSPDDMLAQARAVTKITPWMEANRPDDWTKMMSGALQSGERKGVVGSLQSLHCRPEIDQQNTLGSPITAAPRAAPGNSGCSVIRCQRPDLRHERHRDGEDQQRERRADLEEVPEAVAARAVDQHTRGLERGQEGAAGRNRHHHRKPAGVQPGLRCGLECDGSTTAAAAWFDMGWVSSTVKRKKPARIQTGCALAGHAYDLAGQVVGGPGLLQRGAQGEHARDQDQSPPLHPAVGLLRRDAAGEECQQRTEQGGDGKGYDPACAKRQRSGKQHHRDAGPAAPRPLALHHAQHAERIALLQRGQLAPAALAAAARRPSAAAPPAAGRGACPRYG